MNRLNDRTALVTGGSKGIGRAISRRLAMEGATVAVHYGSDDDAAKETVSMIREAGGRAFSIRSELGVEGDIDTLFKGLMDVLAGRTLDILVNCAAIGGQRGSIENITQEEFDHLFAVNVRAPLFIIQRALPIMSDGGRIINISSADTRVAIPDELTYTMTKGAINALGHTLANALGVRGITVNTIAPGVTETGKLARLHEDPRLEAMTKAMTALGRLGTPEDIADAVAFLASDDARWMTGDLLDLSGGLFLGPPDMSRMRS